MAAPLSPLSVDLATGPVIGTHDGIFHCDEALAVALLRMTEEFANADVLRSRDLGVLERADILVDVGRAYDPENRLFDHHQRGFSETFDGSADGVKLSSAGLVYKHYGREVITGLTGLVGDDLELVYARVYKTFVKEIDAIDNGVPQCACGAKPTYRIRTNISARVGGLNPRGDNPSTDVYFGFAVALTHDEFTRCVEEAATHWLPARLIVATAIQGRGETDPCGRIIVLEQHGRWKNHLRQLEEEMKLDPLILYVVFEDVSGTYRVQAVGKDGVAFENRKSLPEAWRGRSSSDLCALTGIEGCIFVHASGFIGGNSTQSGAIAMAVLAVQA